jgi:DNA-binding MarR family transcriptional regulator
VTPATAPTDADREACLEADSALDADLGWALGVVFRSYVKNANAAVTDLPGGPRGYQVLAAAARGTCNSQLALAQQLGVDRTVMTYLLDDLQQTGLIERQPDPADRRARRIVTTDRGRALLADLDQRLARAEDRVLAALDDSDRETFRALLQRLATHADALDPVASACEVVDKMGAAHGPAAAASRRTTRRR